MQKVISLLTHAFKGNDFPGLLGLVNAYLSTLDVEEQELVKIKKYLALIEARSKGTV